MLPSACGLGQHFQDLGHSFSLYGPPSRQITYISRTVSFISHLAFFFFISNLAFLSRISLFFYFTSRIFISQLTFLSLFWHFFLSPISHFYLASGIIFISHLAFLSLIWHIFFISHLAFLSRVISHLECPLQASVATCRIYGFVRYPYFYCHFQTGGKI